MPKYKSYITVTRVLGTWVTVEADDLADANIKSVEQAMEDDHWQTVESCGFEVCETQEITDAQV